MIPIAIVAFLTMSNYLNTIATFSREELLEEESKLSKVLDNLNQEYKDRVETITLVSNQLDLVRNTRMYLYEKPFES